MRKSGVEDVLKTDECSTVAKDRAMGDKSLCRKGGITSYSITTYCFYPSAQPYCHCNTAPLDFAFPSVGRKPFPTSTYV